MKRFLIAILILLAGAISIARIACRKPPPPDQSPPDTMSVETLARLDGYPFDVRYSKDARAEAVRLAALVKDAYAYLAVVLPDASPAFTAAFLTPDDWKQGYGMPSYDPVAKRLRVAANDNPFWQSFGRIARVASPFGAYPKLRKTYGDSKGNLQLRRFFDLLAVHELAHAFEEQAGAAFPTHWLREIYANLALHAFIAKARPAELANLTTFPEAQTQITVFNVMMGLRGFTSLDDFDRHYPAGNPVRPMSGPNYGWYQVRFHVLARQIFDEGGEAALRRLWTFGLAEAARRQRASDYFRQHGTLAGWSEQMRAKDLAPRLASEVSPRLGRAVARWP